MKIQKILVYVNALSDTHPALQRALLIARKHQVELKIVDIVDAPSNALREFHRPMRSLVEQARKDRLNAICDSLRDEKIAFTTEVIRGRPFVEIVREVVHEGFHLVIKTASGTVPTEIIGAMGPVDMRLVRNCPCPIWLEVPGRQISTDRVLVAIDPQASDENFNHVLLETAAALAKESVGQLSVVAVWEVTDEDFLAEKLSSEKLKQYATDVQSFAKSRLDSALARAGIPASANIHFQKGDPATSILELTRRQRSDVVVMGTVGNTNVGGLLIGNTAETVLRQITCSVFAIKPDSLFHA